MAASEKKGKILIAAIDFGTTFSGYSFSFKSDLEKKPPSIFAQTKWGGHGTRSEKNKTCILFDDKKKFDSFGYEAEEKYKNMATDGNPIRWRYFSCFKMELFNKNQLPHTLEIDDANGRKMSAMTVFAECIRYMKSHLMKELDRQGTLVNDGDIHWVLTVPAIWSDSAKQFMRKAAQNAGVDGARLTIALEPEAASLYCQMVASDSVRGSVGARKQISVPGTKFMVIDLGGGTADITVHKKENCGDLTELHVPTGGYWGGTRVDDEFMNMLKALVGAPVLKKFQTEQSDDYMQLQEDFDGLKRKAKKGSNDNAYLPIRALADLYKDEEEETLETAIKESAYHNKMGWVKGKLLIKPDTLQAFFDPCTGNIVRHVRQLLEAPALSGTNILLMVGGFSESELVQKTMFDAFPNAKIVVPEEAGLAVVKGAVLFGHHSVNITERVAPYTYGVNISPAFDPAKHPANRRVEVNGTQRCRDVFKKYIEIGQVVKVGEPFTGQHITLKDGQNEMVLKIYATKQSNPEFTSDDDYIGEVVVKLSHAREKMKVDVTMMFGGTELTVEAKERSTQNDFKAYFDFNTTGRFKR